MDQSPRVNFIFPLFLSVTVMAQAYDLDKQPSPQEAEYLVKRLSSGFSLSEYTNQPLTPMDDKSLKITTFSLQRYLKVKKKNSNSLTE